MGRLPLVVSPMICNIEASKILVDGGAGLNVLSPQIHKKMQIPTGAMCRTQPFLGLTPVTFDAPSNYRTKYVDFDVANFDLLYNGIMGRPALAKFMVTSHCAYMTIKMPGPQGPISVSISV